MLFLEGHPMESVFLGCFLFGAIFTVASALLGSFGHSGGHEGAGGHGQVFGHGHATGHAVNGSGAAPAHAPAHGHADAYAHGHAADGAHAQLHPLPLLNFTSLVAFLTWFGAAGYAALQFAGWPLAGALVVGVVAGLAGAFLIALFLGRVMAGERVMDARQYRLPGTLARVTISIPAQGVGEIVFVKEGVRRSEAARSRSGRPIARDAQVVVLEYGKGVAAVQPWEELLEESGRPEKQGTEPESRLPAPESSSPTGV
jgi:hypothetical protein